MSATYCGDCGLEQDDYTLTPVDVERAIVKTLRDLRNSVTQIAEARDELDEAEVSWLQWLARTELVIRAGLAHDGKRATNPEVEAGVRLAEDYRDQSLKFALAKSAYERQKAYGRMLEHRLDGLRTLASSLRSVV